MLRVDLYGLYKLRCCPSIEALFVLEEIRLGTKPKSSGVANTVEIIKLNAYFRSFAVGDPVQHLHVFSLGRGRRNIALSCARRVVRLSGIIQEVVLGILFNAQSRESTSRYAFASGRGFEGRQKIREKLCR